MAFSEGEPPGKRFCRKRVFQMATRAGGLYLVAAYEGGPLGQHAGGRGVFQWLGRAGVLFSGGIL